VHDNVHGSWFRLNTRFEFSELCSTLSDDNSIYKSPSASVAAGPTVDSSHAIKSTADLQPRGGSAKVFRKFSSEPVLVGSRQRSRCGFRDRLQADCMEEEQTDCQHRNTSDSPVENSPPHILRAERKACHSRCLTRHNTRVKSRGTKFRRPLSDCGADVNSSSPSSEAAARMTTTTPTTLRLSEDEMRSVCVDVVLAR